MKKQSVLLAVLFLVIGLVGTMAPQQVEAQKLLTKWYVGGSGGKSDVEASGFDDDFGLKFFGGYNFNNNISFEAAFINLGEFDLKGSIVSVDVFGAEASVVGKISIGRFSIFGKGGFFFWEADASTGNIIFATDDGVDPTYGFGFEYNLKNSRWNIRAEWQKFQDVSGSDLELLSIGARYNFGIK